MFTKLLKQLEDLLALKKNELTPEDLKKNQHAEGLLAIALGLKRASQKAKSGIVGVHAPIKPGSGTSSAGSHATYGKPGSMMSGISEAKRQHKEVLQDLQNMPKPNLKS